MSEQLLKEILGELKDVNQRLVNLEEGQNQTAVKVDSLGTGVHNLDTRMETLETKFDNLDTRMGSLETKVGDLKAGHTKLETRIENEVIDKIKILFDAHSLYMDYFASIKDSQARLEERMQYLSRKIIDFYGDLKDQEREIRLLRVERK